MAVREVNLIPAETLHVRRVARRIRMWGMLMVLLPAMIWGGYGVSAVRAFSERQKPHDVSELRREYGMVVAEVARLEQELNEARSVRDLFHTRACSAVLCALADVVPADVQVATCAIQAGAGRRDPWRLVLTGQSSSNAVLGEFARQLEAHATFNNVAMTLSRASQPPGLPSDTPDKPRSGYRIECSVQLSGGPA